MWGEGKARGWEGYRCGGEAGMAVESTRAGREGGCANHWSRGVVCGRCVGQETDGKTSFVGWAETKAVKSGVGWGSRPVLTITCYPG
jgi:hypothetical protein